MIEAIAVMMNNYFHDLAVAFLFASSLMAHLVLRHWPGSPSRELATVLTRVAWGSLIWVVVGGAVRGGSTRSTNGCRRRAQSRFRRS